MIFGRHPACVASGAINTQSPCDKMWTSARKASKILLGNVRAHVLGDLCEALAGFGVICAPLVCCIAIASLNALPCCADAFLSPNIGVERWGGLVLVSYWGEGS